MMHPRRSRALLGVGLALGAFGCGSSGKESPSGVASTSGTKSATSSASSSGGTSSSGATSASGGLSSATSSAGSSSGASSSSAADAGATPGCTVPGWKLAWSDEFNGADGSAVDPATWVHDVGGTGWGNQEQEYYTDGTQNAVVQGGNLVITATTAGASAYSCSFPSNGPCKYTSARLKTQGKFTQQYGRFEARIQIPEGQGIWPAFWMLGADIDSKGWPTCGEVDIMENIGKEPSINHGSLHMPATGTTNDAQLTGSYTLPGGAKLGDAFHTYAIEWDASAIKFFVDDNLYETQTPAKATGRAWEFDQPFFIILNVAVGGQFPGSPDSTLTLPQTMKVDWVRVCEPSDGG
jgi:beta-glucanase (GH16 family)